MSIVLAGALIGTTVAATWVGQKLADLIEAAVRWACRH